MYRARYEADLSVFVVFFISSSMGIMFLLIFIHTECTYLFVYILFYILFTFTYVECTYLFVWYSFLYYQHPYFVYFRILHKNKINVLFNKKKVNILEGVMRSRKSKKDRQYNDQKKIDEWTNNDPQNTTQKTKDWSTPTPIKQGLSHVLWKGKQFLLH